jgi:hypothetical protein
VVATESEIELLELQRHNFGANQEKGSFLPTCQKKPQFSAVVALYIEFILWCGAPIS